VICLSVSDSAAPESRSQHCSRSRRSCPSPSTQTPGLPRCMTPAIRACRPSKLRRISQGAVLRYTRTLARQVNQLRPRNTASIILNIVASVCGVTCTNSSEASRTSSGAFYFNLSTHCSPRRNVPVRCPGAASASGRTTLPLGPVGRKTREPSDRSAPAARLALGSIRLAACIAGFGLVFLVLGRFHSQEQLIPFMMFPGAARASALEGPVQQMEI
jgi:hypothetical protein